MERFVVLCLNDSSFAGYPEVYHRHLHIYNFGWIPVLERSHLYERSRLEWGKDFDSLKPSSQRLWSNMAAPAGHLLAGNSVDISTDSSPRRH